MVISLRARGLESVFIFPAISEIFYFSVISLQTGPESHPAYPLESGAVWGGGGGKPPQQIGRGNKLAINLFLVRG
jgi:hypothetical protein